MNGREAVQAAQTWNWATIPGESLDGGIVRQMIHGDRLMICRLTIPAGTATPAHRHANEQFTIVEKGKVRYVLGTEETIFGPGDIILLSGGFWHGATTLDEEVVLLDIFSPIREDFLRGPAQ
jgi:quercetin dioxygenase-like cupin family protein